MQNSEIVENDKRRDFICVLPPEHGNKNWQTVPTNSFSDTYTTSKRCAPHKSQRIERRHVHKDGCLLGVASNSMQDNMYRCMFNDCFSGMQKETAATCIGHIR